MTIEATEKALATLHDRLHTATKRVYDIAARQQALGFAAFVDNDPQARVELDKLNAESVAADAEVSNIKAAIVEANRRLDAAKAAVARDTEKEHARNALRAVEDLIALAPKLDELVPHPHPEDGREFYSQADPPTCCRAAELMADLVNNHLCALRLTEASFPSHWHGAASKFDLEKALMKTISAGWPSVAVDVAPRWKASSVMPGQAQRNPQIGRILTGWGAVIRKALVQHEQANKERADAA